MPRTILATILFIDAILSSCEKPAAHVPANESLTKEERKDVPATFSAALDALDEMTTEDEKQAYRNDEVDMGLVHKQVGMR